MEEGQAGNGICLLIPFPGRRIAIARQSHAQLTSILKSFVNASNCSLLSCVADPTYRCLLY
jgi:hypothetical protein